MHREAWAARSAFIIMALGAAFGALACGDSSPASPSESTLGTTVTTLYTPKVTGVEPASGAEAGGTVLTITGEHFTSSATVKIGGVAATGVMFSSETTILATTPPGTAGVADVVVTVGSLSNSREGAFTYLAPVDTALSFTVYNHTAGRLGSWTATRPSGTTVTLSIDALGEVVDEDGNLVQAAIPIDSADPQRLVVREGAANGRVGDYVGSSTAGTVSFQVPIAERASYDVFAMNAQNGTDYSAIELVTGVRDIEGADSAGLLDWDAVRLTPTGRDLLAYVFLKSSKGW